MTLENETALKNKDRTRCEIWSRVMGYHRPITSWNPGKQSEWDDRKTYALPEWVHDEESNSVA